VARITDASIDTIKAWRTDPPRRFPSHPYLQRLEPHLESVRRYMAHQFPHSFAAAHPESPEAIAAIVQQVLQARSRQ
jgi:hypothetical protein